MTARRDRIEKLAHALAWQTSPRTHSPAKEFSLIHPVNLLNYFEQAMMLLDAMTRAGLVVRLRGERKK